eukprot:scaffold63172_cov27-Tisochrysis_lutea.AAC.1
MRSAATGAPLSRRRARPLPEPSVPRLREGVPALLLLAEAAPRGAPGVRVGEPASSPSLLSSLALCRSSGLLLRSSLCMRSASSSARACARTQRSMRSEVPVSCAAARSWMKAWKGASSGSASIHGLIEKVCCTSRNVSSGSPTPAECGMGEKRRGEGGASPQE